MTQYIEKSAIVEELNGRIEEGERVFKDVPSSAIMGMIQAYKNVLSFLKTIEAKEAKEHITEAKWKEQCPWKPADSNILPEYEREVIALIRMEGFFEIPPSHPVELGHKVVFAHRPNPDGWDGKSISTGKIEHYTPKTYGKGGWNMPDVVYWLDLELPKMEE